MAVQVHDTTCRSCGAAADIGQTKCAYCKQPVLISTFNSVYAMPMPMVNQYANEYRTALQNEPGAADLNGSIAMCYLKLGQHDKALSAFEKAVENNFDHPDNFFYAAICRLKGKKAFLTQRPEIDAIERDIRSALDIEPTRGIFYYFWAYIKFDYFERKSLNTTPTYRELLAKAKESVVSPYDIEQLFGILGVPRPEGF